LKKQALKKKYSQEEIEKLSGEILQLKEEKNAFILAKCFHFSTLLSRYRDTRYC